MYSSGPLHMDKQKQDDQLEPTYSSSVPIWDVALKTCQKPLTIEKGGERESGISVLMVRCDNDVCMYSYGVNSSVIILEKHQLLWQPLPFLVSHKFEGFMLYYKCKYSFIKKENWAVRNRSID